MTGLPSTSISSAPEPGSSEPCLSFWLNTRLSAENVVPARDVAAWFCDCGWADRWWETDRWDERQLDHAIACFVTDPRGPVNGVCDTDTDAYTHLKNLIVGRMAGRELLHAEHPRSDSAGITHAERNAS